MTFISKQHHQQEDNNYIAILNACFPTKSSLLSQLGNEDEDKITV